MHPLERALKKRGWSQSRLAEEADVSQSAVSMLIAGKRVLKPDTAVKIVAALGGDVKLEQLIFPAKKGEASGRVRSH